MAAAPEHQAAEAAVAAANRNRGRLRNSLAHELPFRNAGVPPALSILPFSGAGTLACELLRAEEFDRCIATFIPNARKRASYPRLTPPPPAS